MSSMERNEGGGRQDSMAGFWALVATQFQGAFNDNAFKMLITLHLLNVFVSEDVHRAMIPLTLALFTLPYLLFSMYSGALADRVSKKRVIVWTKWFEVFVMLLGLGGFLLGDPKATAGVLLVTLFLMAMQSAVFSPAKYGILPEILPTEKLSWGNGIIQMGTFVAIVTGTAASGFLMEWVDTRVYIVSVVLVAFSVVGLILSYGVSRPPAADPGRRISWWPWAGMGRYMKVFRDDRSLMMTMVGIAYFWFIGAFIQQNILLFGKNTLSLGEGGIGMLQAGLALGIGLGSVAAGYMSGGRIEMGLIPIGAVGLALFSMLLAVPGLGYIAFLILLFCLGFSTGFYVIPFTANLQRRSPPDIKGGMIATSNFVTFAGMTVSAGVFYLLASSFHVSARKLFLIAGLMTVVMSLCIFRLLPYSMMRFVVWVMTNMVYRVRASDRGCIVLVECGDEERIMLVHTIDADQFDTVVSRLSRLPESWRPGPDVFMFVQSLPRLPSGRVDRHRLNTLAVQHEIDRG
jgi:acyl-[acyl-carrier-protein]-phospholipid O-acyltransferase/long-chain-fatty-acid--[acyl-carrier-protein] ligase